MSQADGETQFHQPTMKNAFDEYMPYELGMQAGISAGGMGGIFSSGMAVDGFGNEGGGGMGFFEGAAWGLTE